MAFFVANGGNGAEAARSAGYAENSCRQEAYRLIRKPDVQKMIRQEQRRVLGGQLATSALATLGQIMLDPTAPAGARVDAAKTILDRAGIPAIPAAQLARDAGDGDLEQLNEDDLRSFVAEGQKLLAAAKATRQDSETAS